MFIQHTLLQYSDIYSNILRIIWPKSCIMYSIVGGNCHKDALTFNLRDDVVVQYRSRCRLQQQKFKLLSSIAGLH